MLILVGMLGRTRLGAYSSLIALAIPTAAVIARERTLSSASGDVGEIPQGLPMPAFPVITGGTSIDLVWRIRGRRTRTHPGSRVSESAPNPDGSRAEPNRDFLAQGVGNVLSGLFRGQPGRFVGQDGTERCGGVRSRWAAIFAASDGDHPAGILRPRGRGRHAYPRGRVLRLLTELAKRLDRKTVGGL